MSEQGTQFKKSLSATATEVANFGSGAKFTQGECILYHELKLEVFR